MQGTRTQPAAAPTFLSAICALIIAVPTSGHSADPERPQPGWSLPILFVGNGITDDKGRVGYLVGESGKIDAFDLANGKTLWQSEEPGAPLIVLGSTLVAWLRPQSGEVPGKEVMIAWLDASTGKALRTTAPIARLHEDIRMGFAARAGSSGDRLLVLWNAYTLETFGAARMAETYASQGHALIESSGGAILHTRCARGGTPFAGPDPPEVPASPLKDNPKDGFEIPSPDKPARLPPVTLLDRLGDLRLSHESETVDDPHILIYRPSIVAKSESGEPIWARPMPPQFVDRKPKPSAPGSLGR